MAIYHLHMKSISRADGRSATGAIAYRAGIQITDERTGLEFDYRRKQGVEHSQIYFPPAEQHSRPDLLDRSKLWNEIEQRETKSNAQVAREIEFSFPHELNAAHRIGLLNTVCKSLADIHGVVVDASIHKPHGRNADSRNFHAHILFSTRRFEEGKFTEKTREFCKSPNKEKDADKLLKRLFGCKSATLLWRKFYELYSNKYLKAAGHEPSLDHRSYMERGIDQQPTIHEGAGRAMFHRGIESDSVSQNKSIIERNKKLSELDFEIIANKLLVDHVKDQYEQMETHIQYVLEESKRVFSPNYFNSELKEAAIRSEWIQNLIRLNDNQIEASKEKLMDVINKKPQALKVILMTDPSIETLQTLVKIIENDQKILKNLETETIPEHLSHLDFVKNRIEVTKKSLYEALNEKNQENLDDQQRNKIHRENNDYDSPSPF